MSTNPKHPFQLLYRMIQLWSQPNHTNELVNKSYDRISVTYDQTWTTHMRDKTACFIDSLNLQPGQKAIDLTCGTGYATHLISEKTQNAAVGVDRSEGMLSIAQKNYGNQCTFVQSDAYDYLKTLPDNQFDLVTCCWGLGYTQPCKVIGESKRILKKGGRIAIIDNSLFSLIEVVYCSFLTFMEYPENLKNLMRFKFLTSTRLLWLIFKWHGLTIHELWSGKKSYTVQTGIQAIERLRATGAAAGFEYAADDEEAEKIFERFAEIIEQKHLKTDGIKINHRYLAGIAKK